jgi:hypothetical protein
MEKEWRSSVDPLIRDYLELLVSESAKQRHAYKGAKNTANGQLWCALAILSKQVFDMGLKIKFLEKALKDLAPEKKPDKGEEVDPAQALRDALKKI